MSRSKLLWLPQGLYSQDYSKPNSRPRASFWASPSFFDVALLREFVCLGLHISWGKKCRRNVVFMFLFTGGIWQNQPSICSNINTCWRLPFKEWCFLHGYPDVSSGCNLLRASPNIYFHLLLCGQRKGHILNRRGCNVPQTDGLYS